MSSATISKKPKSPPELIRQSNLRHQAGSKWGREEEGLGDSPQALGSHGVKTSRSVGG
jgi:hypothetical protein